MSTEPTAEDMYSLLLCEVCQTVHLPRGTEAGLAECRGEEGRPSRVVVALRQHGNSWRGKYDDGEDLYASCRHGHLLVMKSPDITTYCGMDELILTQAVVEAESVTTEELCAILPRFGFTLDLVTQS